MSTTPSTTGTLYSTTRATSGPISPVRQNPSSIARVDASRTPSREGSGSGPAGAASHIAWITASKVISPPTLSTGLHFGRPAFSTSQKYRAAADLGERNVLDVTRRIV